MNEPKVDNFIGVLKVWENTWLICGEDENHVQRLGKALWEKHASDNGLRLTWAEVEDRLYIIQLAPGQTQKY